MKWLEKWLKKYDGISGGNIDDGWGDTAENHISTWKLVLGVIIFAVLLKFAPALGGILWLIFVIGVAIEISKL